MIKLEPLIDDIRPYLPLILEEQRKNPGTKLGVGTGWSGPKTLFHRLEFHWLELEIYKLLPPRRWDVSAWANIMRRGDTIRRHDHTKSHTGGLNQWAGVVYVAAGPSCCPPLVLFRGDYPLPMAPVPGMLIMFPADTQHMVPEQMCDCDRVSISFNAKWIV